MKALILRKYKQFEYAEMPVPVPGNGEVLVRVQACGICGSDVHGMDGSTGRRQPPIIMGHEAAGIVESAGPGVAEWRPGDRVTFDSTIYCGQCDFCRRGEINLCNRRRVLGVSCDDYRQHGAFAEFVAVPQRVLYKLPEALRFEHAALVEPFAIALHAVSRLGAKLPKTAVVLGAGMIGLAIVQVLKAKGCSNILCADVAEDRLSLAAKCGASKTVNSRATDPVAEALASTNQSGVDAAIEAVGISPTVDAAVRSVRKGGTVVLVGNVSPKTEFPLQLAVTRELNVYGSCASQGEYPECLELMAGNILKPELLISATAELSEGAQWFSRLYNKEPGLLKVILKP